MNCHICNKPTTSFPDEKSTMTYYHCKPCEYIFKSPECYQDLARQKERYNLHQNNAEDAGYQAYFQRFLDFILPHIKKPKTALDFGCGRTLLLATLLEKEGMDCDYYDPIYHPTVSYDSKKYELIVSVEVFEHLHQPKEVFERLVNALPSGGFLAIQTEYHSNEYETFKKWWYPQDPTHIVFFRAKTFEVLAGMFGCEILEDNGKNMVLIQKN